jgi:transposase
MKWIGQLYAVDEQADGDLTKRAELRRTESTDIIATMKTWLWTQATLKTLSIGKAAAYVVANWDRLTRFLGDARIPLDNNATERGIRGPVVGRKNHYGSKSRRGTEIAAVFYTLLETAKLAGVDPARYLREAALADARSDVLLPADMPR